MDYRNNFGECFATSEITGKFPIISEMILENFHGDYKNYKDT